MEPRPPFCLDGRESFGDFKEPVIRPGILNDELRLAVDGEHQRFTGLFESGEEPGRVGAPVSTEKLWKVSMISLMESP
jgi:hypothetical protein